jgi:16S rRNA (cytosine967-C5)-methyltransferase
VASLDLFRAGLVEVQDEGSQLVSLLTDARPGQRVCDFCAGAGGKTLALAAAMANKGHIVACDVLPGRLDRSSVRLRRAGVHNVERQSLASERDPWVKRHKGRYDRVLVDAPCTGIGTWRRNPDAKWRLEPGDLVELVQLQARILDSAARLVTPGGRLVYATCSLLAEENEDQVRRFLGGHLDFALVPAPEAWAEVLPGPSPGEGPYLSLTPAVHGTDGFFIAIFQRRAE